MAKVRLGQTVAEAFDIELSLLTDRADESSYWNNSRDFYISVMDRFLDEMSEEQLEWLVRIEQDL